jgi:hypothetical protein
MDYVTCWCFVIFQSAVFIFIFYLVFPLEKLKNTQINQIVSPSRAEQLNH